MTQGLVMQFVIASFIDLGRKSAKAGYWCRYFECCQAVGQLLGKKAAG